MSRFSVYIDFIIHKTCDDIRTIEHSHVLLNAFKDIDLAVNTGKSKYEYMEVQSHRGKVKNELVAVGSNSYGKWKDL